jgi:hypothetical protein
LGRVKVNKGEWVGMCMIKMSTSTVLGVSIRGYTKIIRVSPSTKRVINKEMAGN